LIRAPWVDKFGTKLNLGAFPVFVNLAVFFASDRKVGAAIVHKILNTGRLIVLVEFVSADNGGVNFGSLRLRAIWAYEDIFKPVFVGFGKSGSFFEQE